MKQKRNFLQLGLLVVLLTVLASCSTPKTELTATPSDAGFVMIVDGKALSDKSGIDNISETDLYKKMLKSIPADEKADFDQFEYVFKNPKESGIGINDEFTLFVKMENGNPVIGMNFKVLDKAKVDALFEKISNNKEADIKLSHEGDLSILQGDGEEEEAVIIWNDKQLLVYAKPESGATGTLAAAKKLINQKASESILSNETYVSFYEKKKDLSFWLNYDLFLKNMAPAQQMLISSQLPFSFKDTYFYGFVDFQKGQVVASYESVLNDEMQEWMEKYPVINDDFDTDVLKMLPKTSYANFEFSINLLNYYHLFVDMYKEKQVDTEVYTAQVEKELGMTIDELLESFSGEMAITLHGIDMKEKTSMSYSIDEETGEFKMQEKTSMQPDLKYSAVIKFTNDKVWGLIETRASELGLEKTNGYYSIPQAGVSFAYVNQTMLITNDNNLLNDVVANGSVEPNLKETDVATYLKKFPTYLEIDLDLDNYQDEIKELLKGEGDDFTSELLNTLNVYKQVRLIPISMTSAKMELELKDDSKNSLEVIINKTTEAIAEINKEKENQN